MGSQDAVQDGESGHEEDDKSVGGSEAAVCHHLNVQNQEEEDAAIFTHPIMQPHRHACNRNVCK